jgi:hypothetical protein
MAELLQTRDASRNALTGTAPARMVPGVPEVPVMSKRPLYLVHASLTDERRSIYRLRGGLAQRAPVEEEWPKSGEWRALIRRLTRNPVKGGWS